MRIKLLSIVAVLSLMFVAIVTANEVEEAAKIAEKIGGEAEVVLWDKTRCDILTEKTAYEVDWAPKWAEAIGQAQWYGIVTHRKPGIILLVKDQKKELKYALRCQAVCAKLEMELIVVKVQKK